MPPPPGSQLRERRGAGEEPEGREDGRVARGARTRRRLAEALITLLEEGDPQPTARRVAEQAGVSLRLVFHHFGDMEAVLQAAVAIQVERHWRHLRPVDPQLPLAERVRRTVGQRATLYEHIAPVRRAARQLEPTSPTIAAQLGEARSALRAGLRHTFAPELDAAAGGARDLLDALDLAAGWESWDTVTGRMGTGPGGATRIVALMLTALLAHGSTSQQGEP